MLFAHDTEISLAAAVQLVNTAEEPDTLATVADLDAHYADYGYTGRHDRTRAELDEVRALRPRLRTLLTSTRDEAVDIVNAMLAEARALPSSRGTTAGTGTCTPSTPTGRSWSASSSRPRWR
ncbi:ABATE domain-containing protein [Nocardioides zeae]